MNDIQMERLIRRMLRWSILAVVIVVMIAASFVAGRCSVEGGSDTLSVRVDSFRDTVLVNIRDTVPVVRKEKVLCYVPADCVQVCTAPDHEDSVVVVQREYSDDSTYTAWVSGVRYAEWPKLDSVTVRQREIVKTVHETVVLAEKGKERRLSVGIAGGVGVGITTHRPDVWIGVGMVYRIPP